MKMSLFLNFEELGVKELKVYNVNNKLILKIFLIIRAQLKFHYIF